MGFAPTGEGLEITSSVCVIKFVYMGCLFFRAANDKLDDISKQGLYISGMTTFLYSSSITLVFVSKIRMIVLYNEVDAPYPPYD